ncbi:MAG: methyltransferase domain-containing protein [Deltaproteobacteria bacterium]|nr:methyltransferase domain-containing protein [Deltaproteobacteria bacterium]
MLVADVVDEARFGDSVAAQYERGMVPLFFQPFAEELAARIVARRPARVLELAAGTGAVTRVLAERLPPSTEIVASDLAEAMIARAVACGTARPVAWTVADAQAIPFDDASFDVVACQFGVMFFPDRARAYAEARRVLRPGGAFVFSTWDSVAHNELAAIVHAAMAELFPADPPTFIARIPHGYFNPVAIRGDLAAGGFRTEPTLATVAMRSRAARAEHVASALCAGTPLRAEIASRRGPSLEEAVAVVTARIAGAFGHGSIDAAMQAVVVEVTP